MSENKLKQNFDQHALTSILSATKDSHKQIIGWKIVGDQKLTIDLVIKVFRKNKEEMVLAAEDHTKAKLLEMLASGADKLNIYLPEDMAIFQSSILSFDREEGRITVQYPAMFAQVERRKHLRLLLSDEQLAPLSFQKENQGQIQSLLNFSKNCFDISAGGCSFIVSKTEQKFFKKSDWIKKIKLTLDEKEIFLSGEIINIFEIKPDERNGLHYKGWKVCLRFKSLEPEQLKLINSYVFRHSHIEKEVI